ncbi:MAG TPA: glycosyltransferase [Candidatus Omnitrophota bacterium]|nr:glycosyltransferase [Candidatus Omnitrophota bacterium]
MRSEKRFKVLIVYTTAGLGHQRSAEALKQVFERLYPDCDANAVDVLDFANVVFRKMYNRIYLELIEELPDLLGYIYKKYDDDLTARNTAKIRLLFDKLNTINLKNLIEEFDPHLIVCTHFLALEIFSDMKARGKLFLPLYCTLTDFYPHAFWVYSHVDKYYVANEDSRRNLVRRGIEEDKIAVTGIPINPAFAELPPKEISRKRVGLEGGNPSVLILNGGFGVGKMEEIVKSFERCDFPLELVVVAGKNRELKKNLDEMAPLIRPRMHVFGFVENIHELMNACDLIVSKPGGLTSSEAMAAGLPMVLVDPIPGQEDRNCEYLLEHGLAARLYDLKDASDKVVSLLKTPGKFEFFRKQTRDESFADASLRIASDIFNDVQKKFGAFLAVSGGV